MTCSAVSEKHTEVTWYMFCSVCIDSLRRESQIYLTQRSTHPYVLCAMTDKQRELVFILCRYFHCTSAVIFGQLCMVHYLPPCWMILPATRWSKLSSAWMDTERSCTFNRYAGQRITSTGFLTSNVEQDLALPVTLRCIRVVSSAIMYRTAGPLCTVPYTVCKTAETTNREEINVKKGKLSGNSEKPQVLVLMWYHTMDCSRGRYQPSKSSRSPTVKSTSDH